MAVESQIAITKRIGGFNLAVRYGIAIRIYASKFWRILIWHLLRLSANPPNRHKRKYAWNACTYAWYTSHPKCHRGPARVHVPYISMEKSSTLCICRARTASRLTRYPNTTNITQKYNLSLTLCKLLRLLKMIDR